MLGKLGRARGVMVYQWCKVYMIYYGVYMVYMVYYGYTGVIGIYLVFIHWWYTMVYPIFRHSL